MQNIYAKMSEGAGKCVSGCYKCCSDVEITYLEFLYLASGFNENELRAITSKPRAVVREPDEHEKESLSDFQGRTALGINPNAGKTVYYCPVIDTDSGKCAAYDRRPWQCRTFQRYEDGRCMAVVHMKILTKNALAQYSITEENKRLAPTVLQDQKNIRTWLQTLL